MRPALPTPRRLAVVAAAVVAATVPAVCAAVTPAGAATPVAPATRASAAARTASGSIRDITRSRTVHVAPGVVQWHEGFRTSDGSPQSAWLTSVDLTAKGTTLGVAASHNLVNSGGETVLAMARRTGAVAGVNGDLFDFGRTGAPYGGEVLHGVIIKSPPATRVGELAVLSNGKAVLGPVTFSAVLARADQPAAKHAVSINNVDAARTGGITVLTSAFGSSWLPSRCLLVSGARTSAGLTVSSLVSRQRYLDDLSSSRVDLLGCGAGADWLRARTAHGAKLRLTTSLVSPAYPKAQVVSLVQGARMVIRNGRSYTDRSTTWRTQGHNPETFVCVARNGTSVLLGTIDGRLYRAVGVTFPQVTAYMLAHGCYDGLVMDGGGSSTTVGPSSADTALQIRNTPAWGGTPRPIANGIFVYRRSSS